VTIAGTPFVMRLIEEPRDRQSRFRGDFVDTRNGSRIATLPEIIRERPRNQDLLVLPHLRRILLSTSSLALLIPMPDLAATAGAAGPAGARPGGEWRSDLGLAAGSVVAIEKGPQGMRYDADTGDLIWAIPATQRPGKEVVILSIREPGKKERIQRLSAEVQP
jgi:hypothetical protein